MARLSFITLTCIIFGAMAYRASTDMVTLGGSGFVGGIFFIVEKCSRDNGGLTGDQCARAILIDLFFGIIYGIGRAGQELEIFKRSNDLNYTDGNRVHCVETYPLTSLASFESGLDISHTVLGNVTHLDFMSTADNPDTPQDDVRSFNNPNVFHILKLFNDKDDGASYPAVQSTTHLNGSGSKRQQSNNDRWVFSYAVNRQYFGENTRHYPNIPKWVVEQMANDLLGRLYELDADNICINFNGEFGLWGKLQVANADTAGGIGASQCDPYYNNDYAGGGHWTYNYQVHDEL
ncbi:hypothetical protein E3Q00_03052 [Wallemia mellicola]|uniref:Uncharacterized protein n=1 Tax=Wallemia mellicola TaxID=1708541 RepID=A0AB74KAG8_9BASI|nr:hypothetical protein E3Q05_04437 [Wallemia mellicola]TIC59149.1 hypothetical protein E3Q03_03968 [Wallemia mellicola]TIC73361.1 hypothetical protein E3Q00_03052 [Wallemia mellicola]